MQVSIEIEKKRKKEWIDHPVRAFKQRIFRTEKSFCIDLCQVNIKPLSERDCLTKTNYLKKRANLII